MLIRKGVKYTMYYDPKFEFDDPRVDSHPEAIDAVRVGSMKELYMRQRQGQLQLHLLRDGCRNPLMVRIAGEDERFPGWRIHPGQTRCRAMREIGWTHAPAFIIDTVGLYDGPGKEVTFEEARELFSDDLVLEFTETGALKLRVIHGLYKGEKSHHSQQIIGPGR
jgi:hypothetical protein